MRADRASATTRKAFRNASPQDMQLLRRESLNRRRIALHARAIIAATYSAASLPEHACGTPSPS
jgi:hypothetical protein